MDEVPGSGIIEVDLFSEEVDGPDHPEALKFRALLEKVARDFHCNLTFFRVEEGTVSFSFDDEALTAEILRLLQEPGGELES